MYMTTCVRVSLIVWPRAVGGGRWATYPKLRLVPVLGEGIHRQRSMALGSSGGVLLGAFLQPGKLVGVGVTLGVELLERIEGMGRESAFECIYQVSVRFR